jgi:hypothetical protein
MDGRRRNAMAIAADTNPHLKGVSGCKMPEEQPATQVGKVLPSSN